ncbi:carcinoembryonic antigen-related cell adhesion molecule [Pristimantis euphronides]
MDLISGKINIHLNPEYPIATESITLSVMGITGDIHFFTWYKGSLLTAPYQILTYINGLPVQGRQYFPRAIPFSNGSLLIKDLQVEDQGHYGVKVQTQSQEDAKISLQVYERVSKPVIMASHSEIKENDFVSLTCASSNADRIIWIKSSSELIYTENVNTVKHDNGTIIFSKISRSDEGKYECWVENVVSRSFSEVYVLNVSSEEIVPVTQRPYGSTSASQYMATSSGSNHADFHVSAHYQSAGVTAGIISGTTLGILLITAVSFVLYKRWNLHGRKQMTGPPIDGPDQYAIYDNILDPTTVPESKAEPLYMCLQLSSEGTYNELHK